MDLISREAVENIILDNKATHHSERIDADDVCNFEQVRRIQSRMDEDDDIGEKLSKLPSAFEGMTNNEVHKAIFGFELDPRYLVTDDTCICGENCPVCPLYNKICNNQNFAEWLDSPYKGGE